MIDNEMKIYWCSEGYYRANETCQTKEESHCLQIETGDCLECEDRMFIDKRVCHPNNITNCKKQNKEKCIECEEGNIVISGKCKPIEDIYFLSFHILHN